MDVIEMTDEIRAEIAAASESLGHAIECEDDEMILQFLLNARLHFDEAMIKMGLKFHDE